MLAALSLLLVLGAAGIFLASLYHPTIGGSLIPGYSQVIHAEVPWILLGAFFTGTLLAAVAAWRRPRAATIGLFASEAALTAYFVYVLTSMTGLPSHTLSVLPGDAFPPFSLRDHTGAIVQVVERSPRKPALYVFYRGDW